MQMDRTRYYYTCVTCKDSVATMDLGLYQSRQCRACLDGIRYSREVAQYESDSGDIVRWYLHKGQHIIQYGQQLINTDEDEVRASHEFGECVMHVAGGMGLLDG